MASITLEGADTPFICPILLMSTQYLGRHQNEPMWICGRNQILDKQTITYVGKHTTGWQNHPPRTLVFHNLNPVEPFDSLWNEFYHQSGIKLYNSSGNSQVPTDTLNNHKASSD